MHKLTAITATCLHQCTPLHLLVPALLTSVKVAGMRDLAGGHEGSGSHQPAWPRSQEYQHHLEADSGYPGDDPYADEGGIPSTSRSSLSDAEFVSGPTEAPGRQRATSAPRDRPSFRATVPRWVQTTLSQHMHKGVALGGLCAGTQLCARTWQHDDPSEVSCSKNLSQPWQTDCSHAHGF